MKVLLAIAGVGTVALLALIFVLRGEASANDGPTCVPSTGFIPQFCVNVPLGTTARRETTVPLSTVLTARADVRVEAGVPAPEVVRLASSVDTAIARVERAFDRPFTTKPRILVFATRASFAHATQELFGYSSETAAGVATTYGGVFDPQTLTIAVSWQGAAGASVPNLLAHELTHLATRQIIGPDGVLPAWFEEGLAARIEAGDTGIDPDAQLAARSLLANTPRALDAISSLADWHRAYARTGSAIYAVSADAVQVMSDQLGRDALFGLLADVGRGARFEDAYAARSRQSLEEFLATFTRDLVLRPTVTVGSAFDNNGNVQWTLSGFAISSDVHVTIAGKAYDLAFTVRTDGLGMYHGTFGSTAARGTYTIAAGIATATLDTASR